MHDDVSENALIWPDFCSSKSDLIFWNIATWQKKVVSSCIYEKIIRRSFLALSKSDRHFFILERGHDLDLTVNVADFNSDEDLKSIPGAVFFCITLAEMLCD